MGARAAAAASGVGTTATATATASDATTSGAPPGATARPAIRGGPMPTHGAPWAAWAWQAAPSLPLPPPPHAPRVLPPPYAAPYAAPAFAAYAAPYAATAFAAYGFGLAQALPATSTAAAHHRSWRPDVAASIAQAFPSWPVASMAMASNQANVHRDVAAARVRRGPLRDCRGVRPSADIVSGEAPQIVAKLEPAESDDSDDSPRVGARNDEEATVSRESRIVRPLAPFHVDLSLLRSFYEEVEIVPPTDAYDDRLYVGGKSEGRRWTVKLGDTVAVATEGKSAKGKTSKGAALFPFTVPWDPAEIVTIYVNHEDRESCAKLPHNLSRGVRGDLTAERSSRDGGPGEVMIEVRWLYRPNEVPGIRTKRPKTLGGDAFDEVFETNHVDDCSAETVLAPVRLHGPDDDQDAPLAVAGMPCMHYRCDLFWSVKERSLVPVGALSGRVARGRMHSAHEATRARIERPPPVAGKASEAPPSEAPPTEQPAERRGVSWKEAMQDAIRKLSLAEADRVATENETGLLCREAQREQIAKFLRKSIRAAGNSSILVSGPPGTGKTASVRSVVAELRREKRAGSLPAFDVVEINAIELRDPLDAYVKFWEGISKERRNSGDAAYLLESHFCGEPDSDEEEEEVEEDFGDDEGEGEDVRQKRPVTVLVLDELDYARRCARIRRLPCFSCFCLASNEGPWIGDCDLQFFRLAASSEICQTGENIAYVYFR
ncbi:hypothetical protein ACHAWF_012174 [Thalassiosira exigua]